MVCLFCREKLISVSEWRTKTLITAEQIREYINQDTGGIRILDTTFALGGADDFREMYERYSRLKGVNSFTAFGNYIV